MNKNENPELVGWGQQRPDAVTCTLSQSLIAGLYRLGVRWAFGLVGGGIAPLADALARGPLGTRHFRHESGAVFAAAEASFATERPVVVFTTTGPGLINALNGIVAARWDGAKVIVLSGSTSPAQRGRGAVQETNEHTFAGAGLFSRGAYFNYAVMLAEPVEMPYVMRRLALGIAAPGGFVAHIALPLSLQTRPMELLSIAPVRVVAPACPPEALDQCTALLDEGHFAIWVGFGARHAAVEIRDLAERTGAGVICSPRAKGVFPEDHPLFHGVTGTGAQESVERYFERACPRHVLVLGTRLTEVTSFWSARSRPEASFIHVDLCPEDACASLPEIEVLGITADVGHFIRGLRARLASPLPADPRFPRNEAPLVPLTPRPGPIRPAFIMQAVQRQIIDATDAPVMTESGTSFSWGNSLLCFRTPGRYRTSAGWGSMGHFTSGVVGAAMARAGKAVAIIGDGAALMNNEVSTAVSYQAQAVWIVLNDAQYGLNRHGLTALGLATLETEIPRVDFVAFACSMGAAGVGVYSEDALEAALAQAMAAPGPFVLDVHIDRDIPPPILERRIASLNKQSGKVVIE